MVNREDTPFSYGAASVLNAVAGTELFWIGMSMVFPVRLSVTFNQQKFLSGVSFEGIKGPAKPGRIGELQ